MATVVGAADPDVTALLSSCLRSGGVAIAPCDTIYGILGTVPSTTQKIRQIKGRGEEKPFIVLYPSVESVLDVALDPVPKALLALWPGALTLIIRTRDGSSGIRVPRDAFLRDVLATTGPLYSTSVNKSGSPALWRIAEIRAAFADEVDMIVDGGDLQGTPSTIVDATKRPCTVVRKGAVHVPEEVLQLCE